MNAPNATVTLPVIDDTTEAYIVSALETMYDAVRNYGKPLPPLADLLADPNGRERIVSRGNRALIALHEHRKEEKVRAFRQGVSEVVFPYIEALEKHHNGSGPAPHACFPTVESPIQMMLNERLRKP